MTPGFLRPLQVWFRSRRNARLVSLIDQIHESTDRKVKVLDVGGSYSFWKAVGNRHKCTITLVNLEESYKDFEPPAKDEAELFQREIGDARDLSRWQRGDFDLVTCNSVLEHVGTWIDMRKAADELRRVGVRGWVQVPAFGFPLEQHFLLPCAHWFSEPIVTWLVWNLRRDLRWYTWEDIRKIVAHTKPMRKDELRRLFPDARAWTEWFVVFPKSHVVEW